MAEELTKQEKISKTVRLFLRNAYEAGRTGRPLKEDEKVKGFLGALSLQGVVLKVGIKQPRLLEGTVYEAVEPLIKE